MTWALEQSQILVLVGCVALVALVTILTRLFVRRMLGKDWAAPRVKVPWRFSLLAIAVLTVIVACVLGLMRDEPVLAILAAGIMLFLWFPIARFLEFKQVVAERRNKEFAAVLQARGEKAMDAP